MTPNQSATHPRRGHIPRGFATSGPALLSYGFRPFFLGAGIVAVVTMVIWIGALSLGWEIGGTSYGALNWHAHEMLFGYATAALAGFMLTAIPNWTGRMPLSGRPLLVLVLLWLCGRIGMLAPDIFGLYPATLMDAAFLPALAFVAGREIVAGRNWKNLKILVALSVLSLTNIYFHSAVLFGGDVQLAFRAGVSALVTLIGIIGGRIIPSFTRNWLVKRGASHLPRPFGRFDAAAIVALVVAFVVWVLHPDGALVALLASLAALLQAWRLLSWRGYATTGEPLLLVLHLAYAFIPIGLFAIAAAAIGWLSAPSALHLLTVGAIGNTTLAVMARVTRGHTGHALSASWLSTASFAALLLSAAVRPLAELFPSSYYLLLELSAGGWILGFGLFCVEHGPMLVRPRLAPEIR